MADCIFCRIVAGDLPSTRVEEDERTLAFMDVNPATEGHTLVVPKRHTEGIWDIDEEDAIRVMATARRVARRIRRALDPDGINLLQATGAAAFQTVFHLHVHVVPRYRGDPIKLPWVPTPGDPERIAETGARIRDADPT